MINLLMKQKIGIVFLCTLLMACRSETVHNKPEQAARPLLGTWKLLTGTIIENGDTTVTDYTKDVSFIKVINNTHFAFMQHDLSTASDSAAVFAAGGGRYSLTDSLYTEHLEYCSAREWEGHDFTFTVSIENDTLIQQGIEKVENAGVNRINIEKYVKVKQ
jgi:hypothetical protein